MAIKQTFVPVPQSCALCGAPPGYLRPLHKTAEWRCNKCAGRFPMTQETPLPPDALQCPKPQEHGHDEH